MAARAPGGCPYRFFQDSPQSGDVNFSLPSPSFSGGSISFACTCHPEARNPPLA